MALCFVSVRIKHRYGPCFVSIRFKHKCGPCFVSTRIKHRCGLCFASVRIKHRYDKHRSNTDMARVLYLSGSITDVARVLCLSGSNTDVARVFSCFWDVIFSGQAYSCLPRVRQECISSPPCWSALDVVVVTASILFHSKGQAMLTRFLSMIINKPRSLTWKRRKMFVMSVCSLYAFQLKKHQLLIIKRVRAPSHQSTPPNNTTIIEHTCKSIWKIWSN